MCNNNDQIVPDITKDKNSSSQAFEFHPSTKAADIKVCVSAKYENGRICVNFPIVGEICFSAPLKVPVGAEVKVCMQNCGFRIGVPPFEGIRATVYFNGSAVWSGVIWGSC